MEKIGLSAILEMSSFKTAMGQYLRHVDTMSSQTMSVASSISSNFASIGGAALKMSGLVAGIGFAGLATAVGAVVTTGLDFNNTMELATAKINAFTKDGGKTAEILEGIRVEASKTPFEFNAMAEATASLLPAAKQSGEAIMDLVKDAEVLAASNPAEGLEGAAFALKEAVSGDFTSVIERFNLPRSMINDLKAEGLPALEIVRQAMQNVGLDMDLVSALANTASGRWSTLKDTFTNLSGAITKPIFTEFSTGLGGINDLLTANEPQLTAFADLMAGQVSEAITTITTKAGELVSVFATGGGAGLLAALGVDEGGLSLFEKVSQVVTDVSAAIKDTFLPALQEITASGILDTINSGLTFVNEHFEEFKGAIIGIGAVVGTGVIVAIAGAIAGLVTPVTLLVAAGALLGAAWAGNWGGIRDTVTAVWATVQPILSEWGTWLGTNIPVAVQALSDVWTNTLQPALQGAWDFISTNILPLFSGELPASLGIFGGTLGRLKEGFTELLANLSPVIPIFQDFWKKIQEALPGLQTLGTIIGGALVGALIILGEIVASNIPRVGIIISGFVSTVTSALSGIITFVSGAVEMFVGLFTGDLDRARTGAAGVIDGLVTAIVGPLTALGTTIYKVMKDVVDQALSAWTWLYDELVGHSVIPDLVNDVVSWFKGLPQKILTGLGDLGAKMAAPFEGLWETINEALNVDEWMTLGGDLMTGLLEGITQNADKVLEFLKNLAWDSLASLQGIWQSSSPSRAFAELGATVPQGVAAGISGAAGQAVSAINDMGRSLLTSTSSALSFIDDLNMGGLARGFGTGGGQWRNFRNILKNEIMAGMGGLADGTVDIMGTIQSVAARFNFPPQMAAEFAQMNGLVEHLTGNFAAFREAMNLENIGNMLGLGGSLSSLGGTLAGMLEEQMAGGEAAKKAADAYRKLTGTMNTQEGQLTDLKVELAELNAANELDTQEIEAKTKAIEKLTLEMGKNQKAMALSKLELATLATTGPAGKLEALKVFLEGTDELFHMHQELDGVVSDFFIDRNAAQLQYNELLAKQKQQEALITKQKEEQQKLDFLKSQLDLINLGRQLGGDIFAGITFGLDASVEDLLAATNAVTMAMVDQINHDLQIHSPSGLMIKTFKQVMAGAAIGIERGQSMLSEAMRSIPVLNGSIPQFSQQAGASSSSTYNYNFPMTVNTAATAQGVIMQYDVRRSLANV